MNGSIIVPLTGTGIEVEVSMISIPLGFHTKVEYGVTVWKLSGNFRKVIPGGENMLPPGVIQNAKLELWEALKP